MRAPQLLLVVNPSTEPEKAKPSSWKDYVVSSLLLLVLVAGGAFLFLKFPFLAWLMEVWDLFH